MASRSNGLCHGDDVIMSAGQPPAKKKPKLTTGGEDLVDEPDFVRPSTGIVVLRHDEIEMSTADVRSADILASSPYNDTTDIHHTNHTDLDRLRDALVRQCLCGVPEDVLRRPFERHKATAFAALEHRVVVGRPADETLRLLSSLQLLFDVYLRQNNDGYLCARIVDVCNCLVVDDECRLVEQLLALSELQDRYVNYLLVRVVSSFLIIAKANIRTELLDSITDCLSLDYVDFFKIIFGLEVIRRVIEWKDVEIHVLEEPEQSTVDEAGPSHQSRPLSASTTTSPQTTRRTNCTVVQYRDSESFDTSSIKETMIKCLKIKWPHLVNQIQSLIETDNCPQAQTCILAFLSLWESTISVKANLSVIDTKPFYADLENLASLLLSSNLRPIVWKQLLSLFNEILCYGSTLALQDMLPDDTCKLAYMIVRYIKDSRILGNLPFKCNDGYAVHPFIGPIPTHETSLELQLDKTLMQKMVLLVLKSIAVTAKEVRCDSSDSSIGSEDSEYNQDMRVIERSVRTVLEKVETFIKRNLNFHPETHFSSVLVHFFSDQDDYLIESMVCTLDVTVGITNLVDILNPVFGFIEFLRVVSHDSDVLLDYLVSNETCFLLYLLRLLKYIKRDWPNFVTSCARLGPNELSNVMSVLIRLNLQIARLVTKGLFPYNITPILELFKHCETLYEATAS